MSLPTSIADGTVQFPKAYIRSVTTAIAATTTTAICTPDLFRLFRVDRAELIVDATYLVDPANYYVFTLQAGATVIATWSTLTGQQGTLTANVPATMVLTATDLNRVVPLGVPLTLVATKNGAAANVQPTIAVHGRTVN